MDVSDLSHWEFRPYYDQSVPLLPIKPISSENLHRFLNLLPDSKAEEDNTDKAMRGGIDLNSANLRLQDIKRDGKGVPLPLAQQDMAQLIRIQGFEPVIMEIKAVTALPIFSELQQKLPLTPNASAFGASFLYDNIDAPSLN